jgi:hypothetical protein
MATSGVITGLATARDIAHQAADLLGIRPSGANLEAEDAVKFRDALNWMLKTWQAKGCTPWLLTEINLTWPADTEEVVLNTNFLSVANAFIRTSGSDRPLTFWTAGEYARLPNKSGSGTPTIYTVVKTIASLRLRIWAVPTANTDFRADAMRVIEDVTDLNQNVDLPQEWTQTAIWNLAKDLLPAYPGTDPANAKRIETRADEMFAMLDSFSNPDGSIFFERG